tara:strand:+ start:9771 stop:10946 length:1176 start_codon:yes stop_codon:yes gene_type:complete
MISLAFHGFGIAQTAALKLAENPESGVWSFLKYQMSHVEWLGCSYWDLIQPSFMFMVGLSMAYSYVKRQREGHSYQRMLGHAFVRSLILVALGIFLTSPGPLTRWWFTNVLAQIGLGYTILFLLWGRGIKTQSIVAGGVLVGTWLMFVLYPSAGLDLERGGPDVSVSSTWAQEYLVDVDPSWHKNANVAHAFDGWLLNLMPESGMFSGEDSPTRSEFTANPGGYQTLNFIPSLVTMLFGLMIGELLKSKRTESEKLKLILAAGVSGLMFGWLLGVTGISPIVKRIWTPSWTLFSTGLCCLILASLYWVIDIKGCRRWTFPLVVVGMNSIAIYVMDMLLKPWMGKTLKTHLGDQVFQVAGPVYAPMAQAILIGLSFWMVCWWMYRQKLFVRI